MLDERDELDGQLSGGEESGLPPQQQVEQLRKRLAEAEDAAACVAVAGELADVLANDLSDLPGAIATLVEATERAPGPSPVWHRLASLYQDNAQYAEAAQTLRQELNLLPEGDTRRERLLEYATVVGRELGDIETALAALQEVTADAPGNDGTRALLESFNGSVTDDVLRSRVADLLLANYRAAGQWQDAVSTLAAAVSEFSDPSRRATALQELAAIKADEMNDLDGAFADMLRAFQDAPADARIRDELEGLAQRAGRFQELADAFEAAIDVLEPGEAKEAIRRKLAVVLDEHLGKADQAMSHYRGSGGQLPDDPAALEAMERLLREQGKHADLAEVLQALLNRLPEDAPEKRREQLLWDLGQLAEEELQDKARAVDAYRALVALLPERIKALRALHRLLEELGRTEEAVTVLDRLVGLGNANPELAADYVQRGRAAAKLGKFEDALSNYRAALMRKREYPEAITALEALIEQIDDKAEVAQLLEPIYAAQQNHDRLAWVLEQKLTGTSDLNQRKALLRRVGDIYENRLQSKERAFEMARRSLETDAADTGTRMWIEKLAADTGSERPLAETYVTLAEQAEADLGLQFRRRAAALLHEKVGDHGAAVAQYEAILGQEPKDEKALGGIEAIYRSQDDHANLVAVLQRRLALTGGVERKREYLAEIARLYVEQLSDYPAAVQAYQELLTLGPEDANAFDQAERLLGELGDWANLAQLYEKEVRRLSTKRGKEAQSRRHQLLFRHAQVLDRQFNQRAEACALLAQILAEDSEQAETIAYLEQRSGDGVFEAFDVLEDLYRDRADWNQYGGLLQRKLQVTADSVARRTIYLDMAATCAEHLQSPDAAFQVLATAYAENRGDQEILARLEALAAFGQRWMELVQVIGVDLDAIPDVSLRLHLLHRLGYICGQQLGDVERAASYLQLALQYDPSDEQSLGMLDDLLLRNQMWQPLTNVLERRLEVATTDKERVEVLERLADVWAIHLNDAGAGLRCHQRILELDPVHPASLQGMEHLHRKLQDWDALAHNLNRQAEVMTDPAEQVRIHAAAAELYTEELGDHDQAVAHWLKVLEYEPSHEVGNQALDVLLTVEERWEDLATHYRRQLTHTRDPETKVEINRRLGVILGDKLGRTDDALTSWQQVLADEPNNPDALRALLRLYEERAMWEPLVDVAQRIIPLADPPEAKEVRLMLARALGENLDRRDEALRLGREVRATEPHTADQMVRLARLMRNIEAWDEAVLALDKAAGLEPDGAARVALYLEVARLHEDQLQAVDDAGPAYAAILSVDPSHRDAFAALRKIYRRTENWRAAVALNESFLPYAKPEERRELLEDSCALQEIQLGEKDLAFILACRVYQEDPSDLEAASVVQRLAAETGSGEEAAAVFEDALPQVEDPKIQVALYRRIARLYERVAEDLDSARGALEKILELLPQDLEALDGLITLAEAQQRYDLQIQALEAKLLAADETAKKPVLFDVARIWELHGNDPTRALSALNRVLEIDGSDQAALEAAARIEEQAGHWIELTALLQRKIELCQDLQQNIALRMKLASVYEGELDDSEAAMQWYQAVLDFDAQHGGAFDALERLYTNHARWSELIRILETQLEHTDAVEGQLRLLHKMASIHETKFESVTDAIACYTEMVERDPHQFNALENLERLLRNSGEWPRLLDVLTQHIEVAREGESTIELHLQMGEIYYQELAQVDKAEAAYNQALALDHESAAALHALGKLYERSGNWFQSLEMLQREADVLGHTPGALPILQRLGRINQDMLGDLPAAKRALLRCLEIEPAYPPALEALKEIAKHESDWDKYAEYVLTAAQTCDDDDEKVELFVEAAKFFRDVQEDGAEALKYYERALELKPTQPEAAKAAAELLFQSERWQEARRWYEVALAGIDKAAEPHEFCVKAYRLGYVCEKLDDKQAALAHYQAAFDADSTYLPALEGLGHALLANEQWEEAKKVLQSVLLHHRDSLTESEVVDIQSQLGSIFLNQNEPQAAYQQLEKALQIDPHHAPSLRTLAELDEQKEAWSAAAGHWSQYAAVAPGSERFEILWRVAEICRDRLSDIQRCIDALERARQLSDAPEKVFDALGDAYLTANQPHKAVEILEAGVEAAENPERISKLNMRLGSIYETDLKHEPLAIQKYNEALDALPTNIKAFEHIERLLVARQEWALLEASYRAMIGRTKDLSVAVRLVLWRNLGELYRRVLHSDENAIMAYEVIQKLDPGHLEDLTVLAELYARKPVTRQKAIAMQHELVTAQDSPVGPIRQLRKFYQAEKNYDAVFVMCEALTFLNEADDDVRDTLAYLEKGVPPRASRTLPQDHWSLLLHSGLGSPIAHLAAHLYAAAPDFFTVSNRSLGLKKKDRLDVRTSDLYFASMVRYVCGVLGVPIIDVYRKSGAMEPLHLANGQPPALVGGENNEVFRDAAQRVVLFHIGRNLAYARGEMFLARVHPGKDLHHLLLGLCSVYNRAIEHSGDPNEVTRWANRLEKLPAAALKRLQPFVQAAYPTLSGKEDMQAYLRAVEDTAARVGLLISGDLPAAARGVGQGGDGAMAIPTRDRIKNLVLFSVSQSYLTLRKAVGLCLVEATDEGG